MKKYLCLQVKMTFLKSPAILALKKQFLEMLFKLTCSIKKTGKTICKDETIFGMNGELFF